MVPNPQGATLRQARSIGAVSYAVGDHGVLMKYDGMVWGAAYVPTIHSGGATYHPNLFAVGVVAEDDVWMAGESGAVYHYDGTKIVPNVPPMAEPDLIYISIQAFGPEDVWLTASQGRIFHWDGAAWTRSYLNEFSRIAGSWGTAADDLWAVLETAQAPNPPKEELAHFDGSTWTVSALDIKPDEFNMTGYAIGLSGAERGRPWVAFQNRVIERATDGSFQDVYLNPDTFAIGPAVDFVVTGPDEGWLATGYEAVQFTHTSYKRTGGPLVGLGVDPGNQAWLFGTGGRVISVAMPNDPRRNPKPTEPSYYGTINGPTPTTYCAPSNKDLLCAELNSVMTTELHRYSMSDGKPGFTKLTNLGSLPDMFGATGLRTDSKGRVALISEPKVFIRDNGQDHFIDAAGLRIWDVALLDDGTIFATTIDCVLLRAGRNDTSFTTVPLTGKGHLYPEFCRLDVFGGNTVWQTGFSYPGDTSANQRVFVRSSDGKLTFDAAPPMPDILDSAKIASASGVPFIADWQYGGTGFYQGQNGAFQLLPIPMKSTNPEVQHELLATRGEALYAVGEETDDRKQGVPLYRWKDSKLDTLILPLHGVTTLLANDAGLWLESANAWFFIPTSAF